MNDSCCENPKYHLAYAPCRPFKAKYCSSCGNVELDCGILTGILWIYFFRYFWDGTVKIIVERKIDRWY